MISFSEAQKIHQLHLRRGPVRRVCLTQSLGSVCALDVRAREDSPYFDKAMMDGFAFRVGRGMRRATRGPFFVSAGVTAGERPGLFEPGTCVKIATGAPVPANADVVVKKEDTRVLKDGRILILKKVVRGENILLKGTHFKKGDRILAKGDRVTVAGVALAASGGVRDIFVFAPPSVALVSTGDEVVAPGASKKDFQIWNATGPMLEAALRRAGAKPVPLGIAVDDEGVLLEGIRRGLREDILILTGAVSMGDRDFVPRLLKRAGVRVRFHKVRMKPGKPILFGTRGRRLVYGLPGNPVSTLVGFLVFVKPAIERWRGGSSALRWHVGVLDKEFSQSSDRLTFWPARLRIHRGCWHVDPLAIRDSADVRPAAGADGFFVVNEKRRRLAKGASVRFIRLEP